MNLYIGRIRERLGEELEVRGWIIYRALQRGLGAEYNPRMVWAGVATHRDVPGLVLSFDAKHWSSGQMTYPDEKCVPGEPCEHCHGSGEVEGLTYEETRTRPGESHYHDEGRARTAADARPGVTIITTELEYAPRYAFFDDGRPKCLDCGGRGHFWTSIKGEPLVWPTFSRTPKGKSWHIENDGELVKAFIVSRQMDCYRPSKNVWIPAISKLADRIERLSGVKNQYRARVTKPRSQDAT